MRDVPAAPEAPGWVIERRSQVARPLPPTPPEAPKAPALREMPAAPEAPSWLIELWHADRTSGRARGTGVQ